MRRLFMISILILSCFCTALSASFNIYVDPKGSDSNSGTETKPLATVSAALRKARELRRLHKISADDAIVIILEGGTYHITRSLLIRHEDSGTGNSPTIIRAAKNKHPVLSGGIKIKNWRKLKKNVPGLPKKAQGHIWVADAPQRDGSPLILQQIWINNTRAIRARYPNEGKMERLLKWDPKNQTVVIPGHDLEDIQDVSQVQMVIAQVWDIARLPLQSMEISRHKADIAFQQPISTIEFEHPWPPVVMNKKYRTPFFLDHSIRFLDTAGEWYEDVKKGNIYYWPRSGENMNTARVVTPVSKTIVRIMGSLDRPVTNVKFQGIKFAFSTWIRPYRIGIVPLQAGMYILDSYKLDPKGTNYNPNLDNNDWIGRPPAAVEVKNANHITFFNCKFEHTVAAGLDFVSGTHNDTIEGCLFRDIGGNGIQMAHFSNEGVETHKPYNPGDERLVCSHEIISNNLVEDCGTEDWGSVGICVGYGQSITIEHNNIRNLPYTGISVGWGWTKEKNCMKNNKIFANRIHHTALKMGDNGGIYTLSAQPGTVISNNAVYDNEIRSPYVYDQNHWFYIYLDEGTSYVKILDNWCPAKKFMTNANGPGNEWENNGPQVSKKIKDEAGLEPDYKYLLNIE